MPKQEQRKAGGGRLSRSETVTVRLDPKLRYLAEIASRAQRRTLSSYIESALMDSIEGESIRPSWLKSSTQVSDHTIGSESAYLWDVDEADRFSRLAVRYPSLLTHDEQVLWKLIRESDFFWRGRGNGTEAADEAALLASIKFDQLRKYWEVLKAVAAGDRKVSDLPT
jgi:hypothetical protein